MKTKTLTGIAELTTPVNRNGKDYYRVFSSQWMIYDRMAFPNLSRQTQSATFLVHKPQGRLGRIFPATSVKRFLHHTDNHEPHDDHVLNLDGAVTLVASGATAPLARGDDQ